MLRVAASTVARRASSGLPRRLPVPPASFKGSASAIEIPNARLFHASARREDEVKPVDGAELAKESSWSNLYAIPIGFTFAIPALHFEWLIINEETQLAGVFMLFCVICYTQAGDMVHKGLVEKADLMLEEQNELEDAVIENLEGLHKDIVTLSGSLVEDFEAINKATEDTYAKLNAAGAIKPQYDFKSQMERVLHLIEQEETSVLEKGKATLMEEATANVTEQFKSSKELQKAAMNLAIAKIKGTAKSDADPVKAAFMKFFKEKAVAAKKMDDSAEQKAQREAMVAKLNAVARNEGFFFEFDASGQPKMVG